MLILTTLLAVIPALCLRDTVAVNVFLEASNRGARSQWGADDILLTCSSVSPLEPIRHAIFTRNQVPINISAVADDCTPSGDQYCYTNDGYGLAFIANNVTEGKYACKYESETSNELAIVGKRVNVYCFATHRYNMHVLISFAVINVINAFCAAYPDEVSSGTERTGKWGMELVLPCRYAPGPLANDPGNFYHHTWYSILNGTINLVSSSDNLQDNDSDFSLTLVKLIPILAEYDYLCEIDFSNNALSQPYLLMSSLGDEESAIDVIISEMEGEDIESFRYLEASLYLCNVLIARIFLLGDVSIEKGPSNAVVSTNELATFSCTLNVTGNEVLQFKVFGSTFNDRLSGCEIDSTFQTHCSWPNNGIDMNCDYSVPYQISCNLILSGLTEASSTQIICSSGTGEAAPSATATLTVISEWNHYL